MKAFKKLMAAALVCVMALSMLTGCGIADKKTEKHMVEALTNAAKDAKVLYTYERNDALDKTAQAAMKYAQDSKKIEDAKKVGSNYEVYYTKLDDTWNSTDDLKSVAKKAQEQFGKVLNDKNEKKAVGIEVDKVDGKNYIIAVVKVEARG